MTNNPRLSIEEQPPPYTEATSSSDNQKAPSVAESLPEYAALPARADKKSKASHRHKKNRKWLWIFTLVIVIIIAGTLGGILSTQNHKAENQQSSPSSPSSSATQSNPPVAAHKVPQMTALAATECDAATIVVLQDAAGDVYLEGTLKMQTWNATNSPYITPSVILENNQNGLQVGTNLSVVCYGGGNSSYINPLTIEVFYVTNLTHDHSIWSSTFQIFYDTPYNPRPRRPLVLQNHTEILQSVPPTPISAVYMSNSSIHLFFLWGSSTTATLAQMTFNNSSNWTGPYSLSDATVYNTDAAMAATVVDSQSAIAGAEIHVFYMDRGNQLVRYSMGSGGWGPVSRIRTPVDEPLTNITRLAAIVSYPSRSPPVLRIYYLQNSLLQEAIISGSVLSRTIATMGASSEQVWHEGVQEPALIAAAARVKGVTFGQRIQVFFVGELNNRTIVNETVWTDSSDFGLRV